MTHTEGNKRRVSSESESGQRVEKIHGWISCTIDKGTQVLHGSQVLVCGAAFKSNSDDDLISEAFDNFRVLCQHAHGPGQCSCSLKRHILTYYSRGERLTHTVSRPATSILISSSCNNFWSSTACESAGSIKIVKVVGPTSRISQQMI